jgi:membrane protein YdbS with pleckstrin-like domain
VKGPKGKEERRDALMQFAFCLLLNIEVPKISLYMLSMFKCYFMAFDITNLFKIIFLVWILNSFISFLWTIFGAMSLYYCHRVVDVTR